MKRSFSYARLGGKTEAGLIGDILARSFAFPVADALPWLTRAGTRNVRVLREGKTAVACLLLLPMGQWFGGRSVPMTGIAAVGVAPHARGRGAAQALMTSTLRELYDRGIALSTLYPATQALYRKVGYEQAGARCEIVAPAASFRVHREPALEMRPLDFAAERVGIVAAYERRASVAPGLLDRSEYIWKRVVTPRSETAFGYAAVSSDGIEGYVYVVQRRAEGGRHALLLTDLVAATGRASRRLVSFLAEHRSLATTVTFYGEPAPPLLALMVEQTYSLRLDVHWMLRIVNVEKALAARGYPVGLGAELTLAVADDVLRENAGRWTLSVANGRGSVRRGGRAGLTVDVRALASLYSGYLSASALSALGLARGAERDLAVANALFAGPAPGMPDMF